jgi:hypothetical protein
LLRANDRTPLIGEVDSLVMHACGKGYASEARRGDRRSV